MSVSLVNNSFQIAPADTNQPCPFKNLKDVLPLIFANLDLESFSKASRVCRCFYVISSSSALWLNLFHRCLPGLEPSNVVSYATGAPFSAKQQLRFVVVYYSDSRKRFEEEVSQVRKRVEVLRGPSGFDGEIDRAWKEYALAVQKASDNFSSILTPGNNAFSLYHSYLAMDSFLVTLVGRTYNGTDESVAPNSQLGTELSTTKFINKQFAAKQWNPGQGVFTIIIAQNNVPPSQP